MKRLALVAMLLILLANMASLSVSAAQAANGDRDRLATVAPEAPAYAAFPSSILTDTATDTVTRIVLESREFGVPFAVRVVAVPTSLTILGAGDLPERATRRMAEEWLASEPVESAEDAADGILLLVVIPRDDHAQTTAAFATGENALPQHGITRERLDAIVDDVMMPFFSDSRIGDGITDGAAMLSYENLFLPPPRLTLDENREALQDLVNRPLAALTAIGGVVVLVAALWLRSFQNTTIDGPTEVSTIEAAALARGRVDDAVMTGILLDLIANGALVPREPGLGGTTLVMAEEPAGLDPMSKRAWEIVRRQVTGDPPTVTPAAMRWLPRLLDPVRLELEDSLAGRGLLNRRAKVESVRMVLLSGGALALALYTIVPSILGMARWGIFAIAVAVVTIAGALWWTWRRSWTTAAGRDALAAWLARHPDPASAERALFDAISRQDTLLETGGGQVPEPVRLVRSLRGLGAA